VGVLNEADNLCCLEFRSITRLTPLDTAHICNLGISSSFIVNVVKMLRENDSIERFLKQKKFRDQQHNQTYRNNLREFYSDFLYVEEWYMLNRTNILHLSYLAGNTSNNPMINWSHMWNLPHTSTAVG
jgi:hypothetical protein